MDPNDKPKKSRWPWGVALLLLVIVGVGLMNARALWEKAKESGIVSDRSDDDPHVAMEFYQADIKIVFDLLASQ